MSVPMEESDDNEDANLSGRELALQAQAKQVHEKESNLNKREIQSNQREAKIKADLDLERASLQTQKQQQDEKEALLNNQWTALQQERAQEMDAIARERASLMSEKEKLRVLVEQQN